ncbi:MAG: TlpA family protein disulfide reductase [Alcanivoracaceae bacterium]|nr:TlpA family protein disulfide reductase [Alcanivoracaceae bacterium]
MNDKKQHKMKNILIILTALFFSIQASADGPSEGQLAPDFEITQLDGTQFKLSDYKGKQSVYLVFWNTWCTFCMKKIPKLKAIQANLADDIKIIAVNTTNKDSVIESKNFQQYFKITYPLAFDHGKKVTDMYGVWGTPTEFIIDINGIIQYRDGVPDKVENYLGKWNSIEESYSKIFKVYLNIVKTFINHVNQTS